MNIIRSGCLTFFLLMCAVLSAQNRKNSATATSLDVPSLEAHVTYNIEEIGLINTEKAEYAAMLYNGTLIFASSDSKEASKFSSNLYQSVFEDNLGYFNEATPFNTKLNSKEAESTTTFSNDGNTVYFTRHNGKTASIYRSTKKKGKWSKPKALGFCSSKYSTAHPSLNTANTRLYFTSDMPGSLGATDIWYVNIGRRNRYSEPINVGAVVNTEGKETHPFIGQDGRLYFASDTHSGLGGLDIFEAITGESSNEITSVHNLMAPINSAYDDYGFILENESKTGFFTSNRVSGKGDLDIYKFSKKELCYSPTAGKIVASQSNQVLAGIQVALIDSNNAVLGTTISDTNGRYRFETTQCETSYRIRVSRAGYTPIELAVTPSNNPAENRDANVYIGAANVAVALGDDLAKSLNLNTISFGVDRFTIQETTARELDKVITFMNENPSIHIEVRSHTDSRYGASYNQQLSKKRNGATVAYLIENGVNKRRVTGKGYGESQPLNKCTNGVKCSEEEHQLNRRSEFIVVKM